jgi:hypothetical protein
MLRRLRWQLGRLLNAVVLRLPTWLLVAPAAILTFRRRHGYFPNLRMPKTFSEKILYRKLFDRRPILTVIADKIAIREYVSGRIGPEYLPKLLHIGETPDTIPWSRLPDRFVIKPNHGSGWVQLVTDKPSAERARIEELGAYWLRKNFYVLGGEWAYKNIRPQLMIEEFLDSGSGYPPNDYKFYVFDGRVEYVQVDLDRFAEHRRNILDRNGARVPATLDYPADPGEVVPPACFDRMIEIAERLAQGWDFIRVDLYDCAGRIVFGELTGTPQNGLGIFDPPGWDLTFGELWPLAR